MRRFLFPCLTALFLSLFLCGCSAVFSSDTALTEPASGSGRRGSTMLVLEPEASQQQVFTSDGFILDSSNANQGYLMMKWYGKENRVKLQINGPANILYTFDLPADRCWHVYPLTQGCGDYTVNVFTNVFENQYCQIFSHSVSAYMEDEFLPYLYPNEYVNFTVQDEPVTFTEKLVSDADSDLDVVSSVFYYVVTNISYDYEKAASVKSGYLPDINATFSSGEGICMDYAALMTAMLRSQQIPTRLDVGYIGDTCHAWISIWQKDQGWIYNIIEFNGSSWNLMDPTFASTQSQGDDLNLYINNDSSYFTKYSY